MSREMILTGAAVLTVLASTFGLGPFEAQREPGVQAREYVAALR